jgi:hypothetical protein
VRRFRIDVDFTAGHLAVTDYETYDDPAGGGVDSQYHRRDLNVAPAIRPDGSPGIDVYGGVFTRHGAAWPHPITIDQDPNGATLVQVDTSFEQKMSLYECAHLLAFDRSTGTMYTTLFGGISDYYYDEAGQLVSGGLSLPFISSVSTLARHRDGSLTWFPQPPGTPWSLPDYAGANAVFVPAAELGRMAEGSDVLDLEALPESLEVTVGHLVGGILATAPQSSGFDPTFANDKIYRVILERR